MQLQQQTDCTGCHCFLFMSGGCDPLLVTMSTRIGKQLQCIEKEINKDERHGSISK